MTTTIDNLAAATQIPVKKYTGKEVRARTST